MRYGLSGRLSNSGCLQCIRLNSELKLATYLQSLILQSLSSSLEPVLLNALTEKIENGPEERPQEDAGEYCFVVVEPRKIMFLI